MPARRKPLATHGRTIHMGQKANARCEQMISAVHPTTDITKILRYVRSVPEAAKRLKDVEIVRCNDVPVIERLDFLEQRLFGVHERQGSTGIGPMVEHQ